jgi:acetyl esterase
MAETAVLPRIDPDMQAAMQKAEELAGQYGPPGADVAAQRAFQNRIREFWYEGGPEMAEERADAIPGPYRDIPVAIYRPRRAAVALPALVYFHGGGFRFGNERYNSRQLREIAAAWGGVVVSTDYAHMPEHVFPAPVEEGAAVYAWLNRNGAKWGIDGGRLAFAGNSAGGSVAMGAAIHVGGMRAGYLKAGVAMVTPFNDDAETPSMHQFATGFYPPRDGFIATHHGYVPDPALRGDPRVQITNADPALIPPLFIAAAELDTLRDASVAMAAKLKAAGRPHRLKIYAGMTHMFVSYSRMVAGSRQCAADVAAFLSGHVPAR